jgi:hypothetical protein
LELLVYEFLVCTDARWVVVAHKDGLLTGMGFTKPAQANLVKVSAYNTTLISRLPLDVGAIKKISSDWHAHVAKVAHSEKTPAQDSNENRGNQNRSIF